MKLKPHVPLEALRAAVWLPVLSVAVVACDQGTPTGDPFNVQIDEFADQIADRGQHDSDPGFAFLDPLVEAAPVPGPFDPNLAPSVFICEIADPAADVATWECPTDSNGDPEYLRVFAPSAITVEADRYKVNWKLDDPAGAVTIHKTYRIMVRDGDRFLGHADIVIGDDMKDAKSLAAGGDLIPLNDDRTLVIAFHASAPWCPAGADCFIGTVPATGATVVTNDGFAAAAFPAGWYDASVYGDEVEVIIVEKSYSDVDACLPDQGGYLQYGSCYTYTTQPDVGEFLENVTIGQCQDAAAQGSPYEGILQLGAWDTGEPVRVLPNVPAPAGLDCTGYPPPVLTFLGHVVRYAAAVFAPNLAWAADLGLGGSIRSFSDVGWLVPLYGSAVSGDGQTGTVGALLPDPIVVAVAREHSHLDDGLPTSSTSVESGVALTVTFYDIDDVETGSVNVVTDAKGVASVPWTLGSVPGVYTAVVTGPVITPIPPFTATAVAAGQTGTISGTLVEAAGGAAVAGANLQVIGTQIGVLSGQAGDYLLPNVPAGPQTVSASLIGFSEQHLRVLAVDGQTADLDFRMGTAITAHSIDATAVTIDGPPTTRVTASAG